MLPEKALVLDEVAERGRVGVRVQLRRLFVGDLRQLERKEHQVHAALGGRFAHASEQPARCVVLRVLAVQHVGVDLGLHRRLFVVGELAHHLREGLGVEGRYLSPVLRLEGLRTLQLAGQRGLDRRIAGRLEKVGQVPTDALRTRDFRCLGHRAQDIRSVTAQGAQR